MREHNSEVQKHQVNDRLHIVIQELGNEKSFFKIFYGEIIQFVSFLAED